jgi:hypothetical protein
LEGEWHQLILQVWYPSLMDDEKNDKRLPWDKFMCLIF